jgi:glycine/betaine/sarcosine/D-proline reductase family selenoprotein B
MSIDSFKWLPPSLKAYYQDMVMPPPPFVPWKALGKPLDRARVALATTAGINVRGEPPFDYERERREPHWGDPTYRLLPHTLRQEQVQTGHLHINNEDIERDFNVVIPFTRALDLQAAGVIGSVAPSGYSFMGYQPNTNEWTQNYAPEVARRMRAESVDAVVITTVDANCCRAVHALARTFEAAGFSTVVISQMPVMGERLGAPRTLGVEFPFGYPCGLPGEPALQTRVLRAALALLTSRSTPPVVEDFPESWPGDFNEWKTRWHPKEPAPIIRWWWQAQVKPTGAVRPSGGQPRSS